jgi:hypothetical protein
MSFAVPFAVWFSVFLTPLQKQYFGAYVTAPMARTMIGRAANVPVWWGSRQKTENKAR